MAIFGGGLHLGDEGDVAERGGARAGSVATVSGGAMTEVRDEALVPEPNGAAWAGSFRRPPLTAGGGGGLVIPRGRMLSCCIGHCWS